jgi:uncharacterized protein YjiS (DUF1127 family)
MQEMTRRSFFGSGRTSLATVRAWLTRLKTRRWLLELDAAALDDVGITERERQSECAKWFWED